MKKKPIMIFSILINILNNLAINEEYSINELSEKSGLHWQTTKEYLDILIHLLKFTPKIELNKESNKIRILEHSIYFDDLTIEQKILINLYENKAFTESNGIKIKEFFPNTQIDIYLERLLANEYIKNINDSGEFYITKSGIINVIKIYSNITDGIFNFKDFTKGDNLLFSENNKYSDLILKLNNEIILQNKEIIAQNNILLRLIKMKSLPLSKNIQKNFYIENLASIFERKSNINYNSNKFYIIDQFNIQPNYEISSNDDNLQCIEEFLNKVKKSERTKEKDDTEKDIEVEWG